VSDTAQGGTDSTSYRPDGESSSRSREKSKSNFTDAAGNDRRTDDSDNAERTLAVHHGRSKNDRTL
jgi:hypothetical protein